MNLKPGILRWTLAGITILATGGLIARFERGDKRFFAPHTSTPGHYQIEQRCELCHKPFARVSNESCMKCHADDLKAANDSHAPGKFSDPRNARFLNVLDARECRSCHHEHRPAATLAAGSTQPADHCFPCHAEIGKERPSHLGFSKDGCAATGCHKYHDNTALYEDFLARRLDEPATASNGHVLTRQFSEGKTIPPPNIPKTIAVSADLTKEWRETAHAKAAVNCNDCHLSSSETWHNDVKVETCAKCHETESSGFQTGRHGMRLAQALTAMSPGEARQPMKSAAAHRELTCNACHPAHQFNTKVAAIDSCLRCHNDEHSLAYKASPHFKLWQMELSGKSAAGTGVSCATCHLRREKSHSENAPAVVVQHNQNANLRPNEKMIRSVCLNCHGLEFSTSALAESKLLKNNFTGRPEREIQSVKMVARRLGGKTKEK